MSTVTIACKLSNGIYLDVGEQREEIKGFANGINDGNGFGLTYGVDKGLWDAWLAENKERALVKNGLIFAHEKVKETKSESKEKKDLQSKTEPLQQKVDGVEAAK